MVRQGYSCGISYVYVGLTSKFSSLLDVSCGWFLCLGVVFLKGFLFEPELVKIQIFKFFKGSNRITIKLYFWVILLHCPLTRTIFWVLLLHVFLHETKCLMFK